MVVETGGADVSELVVYTTLAQASWVRTALSVACRTTGIPARLEPFGGNGSLYQRLRARRAQPYADIVVWFGPYAAHNAALNGLLQPHQSPALPDHALHHPEWLWMATEFEPFRVSGEPPLADITELASAPRLAVADPERSELGMLLLLAMLDRARQVDNDVERAWAWWSQRVARGADLVEEDESALGVLRSGRATHAVTLGERGTPLMGLAPVPHAIALAANAPNREAARRVLDSLMSQTPPSGRLSGWAAESNGLAQLRASAPTLDVDWCTQQYVAARQRWAQSGFGPSLGAT
jgi:hypothetical protein